MTLPILLPQKALPPVQSTSHLEWTPKAYLTAPHPPPVDDSKIQEQEMANARQSVDGKTVKKTRPRRTVDYNGSIGRWILVRLSMLSTRHVSTVIPSR